MKKQYQAFEEGDYVLWEGYKYVVSEVHEDENGFYYNIDEANDMGFYNNMPAFAEATQEELILA